MPGDSVVKNLPAMQETQEMGAVSESGRSPGKGNGNPFQYSFVKNPMDREAWWAAAAKSVQSCLTLCDPIDRSPPGSPVPGILQARTLEWGAIAFSAGGLHRVTKSWTQLSMCAHHNAIV